MKKLIVTTLVIALVLFGVSLYLYSANHPEKTVITIIPPYTVPINATTETMTTQTNMSFIPFEGPIIGSPFTQTSYTPPPSYTNIWPETLAVGIVLLLISVLLLRRKS
ncbi:hypothetical protein [Saccharolobus shibatae]|uniref:Uncharacterized protein n=1 Tax=Saccharolobus shibatae TaxID=2286 RepID=A0A8F5C149_9CREN|nr:hypothetical protein [Saccharolobus shibatae]QXJ32083.1 hypothetical protein J5U21_01734 [Saccharolobus shibatae]QXJ35065.1 hypothetical protein J5U22_01612 [Saccharolobus shibatae]